MCRNPAALGKTLEAMVKSVKIPVTIKIRTGWDADTRNALEVVRAAADAGVTWVAIHGRTRAQQYSGLADWDFIAEVKAKSPIPILGNGDIVTAEQAVEKMRRYGVDAVLIGRGALRNPFIFEQATALWRGEKYEMPSPERFVSLVSDQEALLRESQDVRGSMNRARKLLAWYSSGFPGGSEFRNRIFKTTNPEEAWADARSFFAENVKNRDWKFLSQPFLMGGEG